MRLALDRHLSDFHIFQTFGQAWYISSRLTWEELLRKAFITYQTFLLRSQSLRLELVFDNPIYIFPFEKCPRFLGTTTTTRFAFKVCFGVGTSLSTKKQVSCIMLISYISRWWQKCIFSELFCHFVANV